MSKIVIFQIFAEFKRLAGWDIEEKLISALKKYGTVLMQNKSSVEKEKLSSLKLHHAGAWTEEERQCRFVLSIYFFS